MTRWNCCIIRGGKSYGLGVYASTKEIAKANAIAMLNTCAIFDHPLTQNEIDEMTIAERKGT